SPSLAINKSGQTNAAPGDIITYTLNWTNMSSASTPAVGVQITDMLPPELSYVTNSGSAGANCVGSSLIWDLGNLAIGTNGSVTYQATVNSATAYGVSFHNYAQILSSEDDANPADNFSMVTTTVRYNRTPIALA